MSQFYPASVRGYLLALLVLAPALGWGQTYTSSFLAGRPRLFAAPHSCVPDGAGHLFISDAISDEIYQYDLATGALVRLAGKSNAYADGVGADARFDYPSYMAYDGAGTLYIADYFNHSIRKLDVATRAVTTLAGLGGNMFLGSGGGGYADGVGTAALFYYPSGLALDGAGHLYVADQQNNRIRKIDIATGAVTTIAGTGTADHVDGTTAAAAFNYPTGLAYHAGILYVSDQNGNDVRRIDLAGDAVSTLAGAHPALRMAPARRPHLTNRLAWPTTVPARCT